MPEPEVKKYIVRLSADERERLEALIHKGKHPAARVLKGTAAELGVKRRSP
jgi:hypothetical protein